MIRNALSLALILMAIAGSAHAQTEDTQNVSVGDKVRVRARTLYSPVVGAVTGLNTDTLHIRIRREAAALAIPLAEITRIEVSRGRRSNFLRGIALGGLVGAFAGASIGLATSQNSILSPTEQAGALGAIGAGAGALIGGIIGAASSGDRWVVVQLDRAEMDVSSRYDGRVTLSLTYGF